MRSRKIIMSNCGLERAPWSVFFWNESCITLYACGTIRTTWTSCTVHTWPIAIFCRRRTTVCFCFACDSNYVMSSQFDFCLHAYTHNTHVHRNSLIGIWHRHVDAGCSIFFLLFFRLSVLQMLNLCAVTRWCAFAPNSRHRWKNQ